jgi:RHS repeat-associated protein
MPKQERSSTLTRAAGKMTPSDGTTYFEHQDWTGTSRLRTDDQGNTAESTTSLPFGDGTSTTVNETYGGQDNTHFAMLDLDSETDTNHALFRQYMNTVGSWMSPDPYAGSYDASNPQSMNRYSYVLNNPLAYVDPDGTSGCDPGAYCETDYVYGGIDSFLTGYCSSGGCYSQWETQNLYLSYGGYPQGSGGRQNGPGNSEPKNGHPRTPSYCTSQALKKNAVALSFDAAGALAGLLPGGDLVVATAQGTVSVASGINSAVNGDAIGSALGVLGLPAGFAGASAKFFGEGARAIPDIGTAIAVLGGLNDALSTYNDYEACMAGH